MSSHRWSYMASREKELGIALQTCIVFGTSPYFAHACALGRVESNVVKSVSLC
jgi:hypothetical protein